MSVLEVSRPYFDVGRNESPPHSVSTNITEDAQTCQHVQCYPNEVFEAATGITVVLAVFGGVGNILTVLAILTSRLRNNINSILICNLSFADAVYCCVVLPLQAMAFHNKAWTLNDILCELEAALRICLIGVNMLLLSCIAFYRCVWLPFYAHILYVGRYDEICRS